MYSMSHHLQSTCSRRRAFTRAIDCITCVCSCVRVVCVHSQFDRS